jgi:hypothetical protein
MPSHPPVEAVGGSSCNGTLNTGMMTIEDANALQSALREEMLQSLVSPRRTEPRSITETELLTEIVLPYIQQNPLSRNLLRQSAADLIPEELAEPLSRIFRKDVQEISRLDLLSVNSSALGIITQLDEPVINQLKADLLGKPIKFPGIGKTNLKSISGRYSLDDSGDLIIASK